MQSYTNYTYDALGNPISMTTAAGTFNYTYDADSQLISVQAPGGRTITYQYDAAGNRVAVIDSGTTTLYTTNDRNQYTAMGGATYQYDADGNLLSKTDGNGTTTYSYDLLGELTKVVAPGNVTTTYQYDALGDLVSQTQNGNTTNYLVDPTGATNVVGAFSGNGSTIAQYTYGLGLVSQITGSGSSDYYGFDLTGSTTQLTSSSGTVLNTYSYLPFGEMLGSTGSTNNPFTYVGQAGVMDGAAGLYYMHNRWYDNSTGRFTQPDPSGLAGGDTNLYRYTENAPVGQIDSQGLGVFDWWKRGKAVKEQVEDVKKVAEDLKEGYNNGYKLGNGFFNRTDGLNNFIDNMDNDAGLKALDQAQQGTQQIADSTDAVTEYLGKKAETTMSKKPPTTIWGTIKAYGGLLTFLGGLIHGGRLGGHVNVDLEESHDPNEMIGPSAYGSSNYVNASAVLPYAIGFENAAAATASAAQITITQQLDANLDWSTFQLGDIDFGNLTIAVPAGLSSYSATVDETATMGVYVNIVAAINAKTGLATWTLTALDPTTMQIPADPLLGLLPPDVTPPQGDGLVKYTIRPKAGVATGTIVNAQASIVFDVNTPIATAKVIDTADAGAPTSSIAALPATTPGNFTVSWSGQDDTGGSGVVAYDIYVAANGGAFTPWLSGTTLTSSTYTGTPGNTYSFYSLATDNVGNRQAAPAAAQTIKVVGSPGSIAGTIYGDTNHTGVWNPADPAVANVMVYLDANGNGKLDAGEISVATDANGNYLLANLPMGNYAVREVAPGGYVQTYPTAEAISVTVGSGQAVTGQTFLDAPTGNATPEAVYRLYSPVTLEHLYTTDPNEYNTLISYVGTWNGEGEVFSEYSGPATVSGVADEPLYRLYDAPLKQHFWTDSYNEYNTLRNAPWNWNDEGIVGYVFPSAVAGSEPLYRMMAPQVHLWTTDVNEYDVLVSAGWTQEGIIGYVL